MKAILTGAAGFIGFHTSQRLLQDGWEVVGVDNLNPYYAVSLKEDRLSYLKNHAKFRFIKADIADAARLNAALAPDLDADIIIHLAAQAGVRYSIENPASYVNANVQGQVTLFELARKMTKNVPVVYASSSSVYGANSKIPFAESDPVDSPVSVYAATKRAGELLAGSYRHVHEIYSTGLRFFTVYGPWGRPDMAPWLFTASLLANDPIQVFNHGKMKRDFTYIDDIIDGIMGAIGHIIDKPEATSPVYNLGNNQPIELSAFIQAIEKATGCKAKQEFKPMPPADVPVTYADIDLAQKDFGFQPKISIDEGMKRFVAWFQDYGKKL